VNCMHFYRRAFELLRGAVIPVSEGSRDAPCCAIVKLRIPVALFAGLLLAAGVCAAEGLILQKEFLSARREEVGGEDLVAVTIFSPPAPPVGVFRETLASPPGRDEEGVVLLSDVPAYDWSFGCSATAGAMLAGYYDRTEHPSIYTGPTNGGVATV